MGRGTHRLVSGGTIAKRTLVPAKFIGDVTVTGTRTPVAGVANAYSAAISGTATDQTYIWSTTDGSATLTNATSATPTITYSSADTYTTTCKVTRNRNSGLSHRVNRIINDFFVQTI